jgi:hypothetical protein
MGYLAGDITPRVTDLVAEEHSHENSKAFIVPGQAHVLLGQYGTLVGPGDVTLKSWTDAFLNDAETWVTVQP